MGMDHVEPTPTVFARGGRPRVLAASEGDCAVVWLSGDHDASTVAELSGIVDRVLSTEVADFTFDLSAVTFMDSTTVAVITQTEEYLQARSRSVVVRAPSRFARVVLDPYGLRDFADPNPGSQRASAALGSWVAVPPRTASAPSTDATNRVLPVSASVG